MLVRSVVFFAVGVLDLVVCILCVFVVVRYLLGVLLDLIAVDCVNCISEQRDEPVGDPLILIWVVAYLGKLLRSGVLLYDIG